jgi:addiction module HigA family antidote
MIKPGIAFHPWEYLADALEAKGRTQKELSEIIEISKFEVNDIIKWRRNITPRIAYRLWEAFGDSWETWLKLQAIYDIYLIDHNEKEIAIKNQIKEKVKELTYA